MNKVKQAIKVLEVGVNLIILSNAVKELVGYVLAKKRNKEK